jgi:diguanylate cyclase (GGDEF)-like protein
MVDDLNRRVFVDALTSVRNKGAFDEYIQQMQDKLDAGEAMEFAIGVFDCDDLKSVNDLYGHDKGDVYLKSASRVICRVFQHSPVFRIGGDEFAVVLRNDDFRYREELLASFEKATARASAEAENRWEQVHVAIGIAVYDPIQDHSVIDTMRRADKAMYVNKRKRKNGEA